MATASYVARRFNEDPPPYPTVAGPVVGGETALDVRDGDGSYVEVRRGADAGITWSWPNMGQTFRVELEAGSPQPPAGVVPAMVSFEVEWDYTASDDTGALAIAMRNPATGGRGLVTAFRPTTIGYATDVLVADPAEDELAALLDADTYFELYGLTPTFGQWQIIHVTYLRMLIEFGAEPLPLRQRQRDDGLGLSTARWRQGRSRQASNRWKGYL